LSRADLKAKTKANLTKQNENESNSGFDPGYQHPAGERGYLNLERDQTSIFRFVNGGVDPDGDGGVNCTYGNALSDKGKFMNDRDSQINPGENMLYYSNWCNNDKGKNQPVTWPSNVDEFNSHIFTRALREILDYKWDAEAIREDGGKGKKKYTHAGDPIHTRVAYNGEEPGKYSKEMLPMPRVICNVIDRLDPEFHAETGYTKVLTDNGYINKDDKFSCEPVINLSTYKSIVAALAKENKLLEEVDVAYHRYSQKSRPKGQQSYSDIYVAWLEKNKAWNGENGDKYTDLLREEPFDDHPDDAKLKLVDLAKFVKPTKYKTIQKGFLKLFEAADRFSDGKKGYVDELQKLVEAEAITSGEEKTSEKADEPLEAIPETILDTADKPAGRGRRETEKVEEKPSRSRRGSASEQKIPETVEVTYDEFTKLTTDYKGIDSLDEEDQKGFIFYSNGNLVQIDDKGEVILDGSDDLLGCTKCDFPASFMTVHCPKCGEYLGQEA